MNNFQETFQKIVDETEKEAEKAASDSKQREDISDTAEALTSLDQAMTQVIIQPFRDREESFQFLSEELKKTDEQKEKSEVDYTVIFDEIDGTGNFKDDIGPYGPIVGVAEGADPDFEDMTASMFYDLKNNVFYEAYRDQGAFMDSRKVESAQEIPEEKAAVRGIVDQAMVAAKPELAEPLWKYHCRDLGSMGHNLVLVASDRSDFLVTGGHGYVKDKKTAEEIAPLYLFIKEADAAMTDWEGKNIAKNTIGMKDGRNHDIIAAANQEFAEQLAEELQKYTR